MRLYREHMSIVRAQSTQCVGKVHKVIAIEAAGAGGACDMQRNVSLR